VAIDAALAQVDSLISEGADLIDVGGESTRPGAIGITIDTEIGRTGPVIRAIAHRWPAIPISVDTVKADVARAALDAGAWIVNDVAGLRLDPLMGPLIAETGAGVILMHSRGGVAEMARYETAVYGDDAVGEIVRELAEAVERAGSTGMPAESIVIDPGLGFSKTTAHSLAVLANLHRFASLGLPVMVGPSRKRFIGEAGANGADALPPGDRLEGTVGACVAAYLGGADLFRVHDVRAARRALDVAHAIRKAS
jgi:dihydropteroate synthase